MKGALEGVFKERLLKDDEEGVWNGVDDWEKEKAYNWTNTK